MQDDEDPSGKAGKAAAPQVHSRSKTTEKDAGPAVQPRHGAFQEGAGPAVPPPADAKASSTTATGKNQQSGAAKKPAVRRKFPIAWYIPGQQTHASLKMLLLKDGDWLVADSSDPLKKLMHVAASVTYTSESKKRERTKLKRFRFALTLGRSAATGARQWTFAGLKYPSLQGAVIQAQRQPLRFNATIIKMQQPAKGTTVYTEPRTEGAARSGGGGEGREGAARGLPGLRGLGIRDDDLPTPVDTRPEPPAAQGARVLTYSMVVLVLAVCYGYWANHPQETEMLIAEHLHGVNAFILRNFGVNLSTFVLGDDGEGMLGSIGIATRGGSDAAAAAAAAASATAAAAAAAADPLNAISDYFTLGKSKFCQAGTIAVVTSSECKIATARLGLVADPAMGSVWSPGMRCYEAQGQHGTTPEEGNVVTMLSNRADNVDRRAICKKGCQLRQHWCDSAFEYSRADCTGDGLLDHVCTRLDGSVLVQAAATMCDGTDHGQPTVCGHGTPNEMAERRFSAAGPWSGYYLTSGWPMDASSRRASLGLFSDHPIVWCSHVSRTRLQCRGVQEREDGVADLTPQNRGWALEHSAIKVHEATSELFIANVGTPSASIEVARLVGKLEQTQDTPKTHAVRWSDGSAWTRMSGLWTLGGSGALTCPDNYVPVETREECEHAAEQLGFGVQHATTPPEAAVKFGNTRGNGQVGEVEAGHLYPQGFGKNKVHKYYRECAFVYNAGTGARELRLQRPSVQYHGAMAPGSTRQRKSHPTDTPTDNSGGGGADPAVESEGTSTWYWHGARSKLVCRAHASSFQEWVRPGSTENGAHLWHDPVQPRDPLWKNKLHGGALRYAQSLQIAASAGNTLGASNYATMQLFGNLSFAIPRNVGAARSTFAKLAAQGHPVSQQMIGFMADLGLGGDRNASVAMVNAAFSAMGGNTYGKLSHARRLLSSSNAGACEQALSLYREASDVVEEGLTVVGEGRRAEKRLPYDRRQGNVREDTVSYWLMSASNGDQAAQFQLGEVYYFGGWGEQQNYTKAHSHFFRARGLVGAQARLGEMYAYGLGVRQNYKKAFGLLQTAANHRHGRSQALLGMLYMEGNGVPESAAQALQWFTKAAGAGDALGELQLANMHYHGVHQAINMEKAVLNFKSSAVHGSIVALYNLGLMYSVGDGVERNCERAIYHFKRVVEGASWAADFDRAYEALFNGDVILALLRYLWLAELGYELAQYNAAYIIQNHHAEIEAAGVFVGAKPLEIALLLLQRSADQEHVDSVVQVADVLYGGILAAEDQAEAFRLYRVAGQAGSARALFNIGWAHQSGDGLPLDLEIAKRYYDMALATEQEAWAPVSLAKAGLMVQTAVFDWTGIDLLQTMRACVSELLNAAQP